MLNKIFSMKMAVITLLIFATSIGYATFVENDYGTQTARALIYNAKWFEVLLLYFCLLIVYNIIKFKMYKKEKWGFLVLHIAFLLIAVGSLITRYTGFEGIMHIREGGASSSMVSDYMNLNITIHKGKQAYAYNQRMTLSSKGSNSFSKTISAGDEKIDLKLLKYIPAAQDDIVPSKNGKPIAKLVVAGNNGREDIFFEKGKYYDFGSFVLDFQTGQNFDKPTIHLYTKDNKLYFKTPFNLNTMSMKDFSKASLNSGEYELKPKTLYSKDRYNFVLKKFYNSAKIEVEQAGIKSSMAYPQMIKLKVSNSKDSKTINLFGRSGELGKPQTISLGDTKIDLSYGAKTIELPFAIKLKDFIIGRYPGSNSPSSFSSMVKVLDGKESFDYHIYMNHVLDYKGYRFFQSSYDRDEKGTILSVNHDPGTLPTYIGYILLALGFLLSYISKKSRFTTLLKKLEKVKEKRALIASIVAIFIMFSSPLKAGGIDLSNLTAKQKQSIENISKEHADKFGELTVLNFSGRLEPLDTLNLNVVKKLSGKDGFDGLNYNQIVLGILVHPEVYQKVRFIKFYHPKINKILHLPKDARYLSFNDVFDKKSGKYLIENEVNKAKRMRPALRGTYEKALIKIDEKLNILYMASQGTLLKIFPKLNDKNNNWYNPENAMKSFSDKDKQVIQYILSNYLKSVLDAIDSGDWKKADKALNIIKGFQKFYGSKIMPSKNKMKLEILYNKSHIFLYSMIGYMTIGFILLILAFIKIIKPKIELKALTYITVSLLILTLIMHTIGLGAIWYISGHAPWNDAFGAILYISWATAIAGFVFSKKSPLAFAATAILAGIFLLVAYISNMDPQITNLRPVLKSYWLVVHVAIITASYGFLGLGALLGMFNLLLMIINKRKENTPIFYSIKELTIILELSLLIGLALVTVGNFLGGVWANESWGRYWSWDPKETWAAVTILVYAAILHMRFVPKLSSIWLLNVFAVLGYASVIMTYFGVNYYLSGMHSYATGDPVPIPSWVYYAIAGVFTLIAVSYKYKIKGKI